MYDTVIIGSGIAGMTSAIYLLRANKKVLILEKKSYGGQIIDSLEVENYPGFANISGFELSTSIYNQVKSLGGEFKYEEVTLITENKKIITKKNEYQAKSIILATGVVPRKLNLDLEDKLIGKGISYCATCDGRFYKNQEVAVVGGGNTALEDALYLSDLCKKVYLIHRRNQFRGEDRLTKLLKKKKNVEIIYDSTICKINGNDTLSSIDILNNQNTTRQIPIKGLFIAIGRVPNNHYCSSLIDLDRDGYILSKNGETNIEGIFVAGDTRVKEVRQLVTASSDGAIAASKVLEYLNQ